MNLKSIKRKHEPMLEPLGVIWPCAGTGLPGDEFACFTPPTGFCPKIFITEEKMANALKDLRLVETQAKSPQQMAKTAVNLAEEAKNDLLESSENDLVFSSELKQMFQNEEILNVKSLLQNSQKCNEDRQNLMQIIPWTPPLFTSSGAGIAQTQHPKKEPLPETNVYKVEEPQCASSYETESPRNKLKRKHSHLRKIRIEEMHRDDYDSTCRDTDNNGEGSSSSSSSSYYVVDAAQNDEQNHHSNVNEKQVLKDKPHFFITNLSDDEDNAESMDI